MQRHLVHHSRGAASGRHVARLKHLCHTCGLRVVVIFLWDSGARDSDFASGERRSREEQRGKPLFLVSVTSRVCSLVPRGSAAGR